jgi:large subunit ribosomal protein L9
MRVILLKDIKGIGKKLDVKEVKDGYGRNFLLARGLAEAATSDALNKLEAQKKIWEAGYQKLVTKLKEEARKIEALSLNFKMKVGEKGETFGSVSHKDIEMELAKHGCKNVKIELEKSIKTVGEHSVLADLGEGIKAKLKVVTVAE